MSGTQKAASVSKRQNVFYVQMLRLATTGSSGWGHKSQPRRKLHHTQNANIKPVVGQSPDRAFSKIIKK